MSKEDVFTMLLAFVGLASTIWLWLKGLYPIHVLLPLLRGAHDQLARVAVGLCMLGFFLFLYWAIDKLSLKRTVRWLAVAALANHLHFILMASGVMTLVTWDMTSFGISLVLLVMVYGVAGYTSAFHTGLALSVPLVASICGFNHLLTAGFAYGGSSGWVVGDAQIRTALVSMGLAVLGGSIGLLRERKIRDRC